MDESAQVFNAILRKNLEMPIQMELEPSPPPTRPRPKSLRQTASPGRTFLELLRAPDAPLDQLILLKNFAKANLNHPENELPRPIFTVIYYASIAAALSRHGKKITQLENAELKNGLQWGAQLPWAGQEIETILREGLRCLEAQS